MARKREGRLLSEEQQKIITDNAGNSYEVIAVLAKCSRTAVYQHLKDNKLTIKQSGGTIRKSSGKPPEPSKKTTRHPAVYSNRDYMQAYL